MCGGGGDTAMYDGQGGVYMTVETSHVHRIPERKRRAYEGA
jgi:hypothetical protein